MYGISEILIHCLNFMICGFGYFQNNCDTIFRELRDANKGFARFINFRCLYADRIKTFEILKKAKETPIIFRSNIQNFLINPPPPRYQLSYQLEIEKLRSSSKRTSTSFYIPHLRIDTNSNRVHKIIYENTNLRVNSDLSEHPKTNLQFTLQGCNNRQSTE